jgi:hypothetical protein
VNFTARLFNKTCHMNMCITGQPDLTDEEPKSSDWDRYITLQVFQSSPERVWGKVELRLTAEEFLVCTGTTFRAQHVNELETKLWRKLVDQVA